MKNMQQMKNTISIPVIILTLGLHSLTSFAQENSISSGDTLSQADFDIERLQDLGPGKRVYGYLSEFKRYPVYNFGLGKRSSHLYNFGLGKRSGIDESLGDFNEYDEYAYNEEEDRIPELELYQDDVMQGMDKRQKLYSFGLGKRLHRYDFGLGKRFQPVLNRDKLYNFGLGKRNRLYSFGLGKRPYNPGSVPGRFNFGLGKRSENVDVLKNVIAKREVHEDGADTEDDTVQKNKPVLDSSQASTNKLEKLSPSEPESHEIMGHPGKSQLSKRSFYRYTFEMGKPVQLSKSGFSRQFRKPLYSFGLGKRTPLSNNPAKN